MSLPHLEMLLAHQFGQNYSLFLQTNIGTRAIYSRQDYISSYFFHRTLLQIWTFPLSFIFINFISSAKLELTSQAWNQTTQTFCVQQKWLSKVNKQFMSINFRIVLPTMKCILKKQPEQKCTMCSALKAACRFLNCPKLYFVLQILACKEWEWAAGLKSLYAIKVI